MGVISSIHSKFLVHWTGKDITLVEPDTREDPHCTAYITRLKDIVRDGLWMKIPHEDSHDELDELWGVDGRRIQGSIAKVCFTEVRLSETKQHASKYGLLGIGFDREFVLSRYGNPVFYVENSGRCAMVGILGLVLEHLQQEKEKEKEKEEKKPDGGQEEQELPGLLLLPQAYLLSSFQSFLGFVKGMSGPGKSGPEGYDFYEEMEWRIVDIRQLRNEGRVVPVDRPDHLLLKFEPKDIRLIVFPNDKIKTVALQDGYLRKQLLSGERVPMFTTLDDCAHF